MSLLRQCMLWASSLTCGATEKRAEVCQCYCPAPGHSRVFYQHTLLIQWELAVTARLHNSGSGMGLVMLCPRVVLALPDSPSTTGCVSETCVE